MFTFWYTLLIQDLTVGFCKRWVKSWKLTEQMNGAARSGKQNIVEGSEAMQTSLKMAIKLTNTAKASTEELLADYEDFLRQKSLVIWGRDDPRIIAFRKRAVELVSNLRNLSNLRVPPSAGQIENLQKQLKLPQSPEEAANLMLTLCHQASYLLNKQVIGMEKKHETEGGFTEKLYWKRKAYLKRNANL